MMMTWFGKSWHAPVNEETQHVDTPVGEQCIWCPEKIKEGDRGVVMDAIDVNYVTSRRPAHLLCFMQNTVGGMLARRVYNMIAEREGF